MQTNKMKEEIKADESTDCRQENIMNNSESERFKFSKDQKMIEISKIDNNNDLIENKDDNLIIEEIEDEKDEEDENSELNDDENVIIEKKTINIERTTVREVLKESKIKEK
jgi:hypothetical protein